MNAAEISAKLPYGKTPEAKAKRSELFKEFDPNGNGYLSLAEVDRGVRDVLKFEELYDCKPAIIRAFNAAKGAGKSKAKLGADFVERSEFRLILVYLCQYFELYEMFSSVDTSDDRKVSKDEFLGSVDKLKEWGLPIADPEAEFDKIDTNHGGSVLFVEFADWALKNSKEFQGDDE
ncbi:hypothetical protein MPTK1_5g20600 [Marchantia polymorpha subsp. ruderalis]|uniref:EF-hand domain-containing protein n=2 Tax=Marchantia polymorpha TaxID=3197 RepID=A0AAF6BKG3_MARPO|nr:hypothetical protein MARPO_0058s0038 [Marchantia polymorpha]BBN12497.1 hypothetical protein Mp_5g20600 [Marchantia polymorpha subsp. ruderalis]|eukprot:PTQ37249.1 hypothetical protein MARPO_0058s0038 [Marchantia polymorpha]